MWYSDEGSLYVQGRIQDFGKDVEGLPGNRPGDVPPPPNPHYEVWKFIKREPPPPTSGAAPGLLKWGDSEI